MPHRGGCVCYSGDFICAKEDYTKAFKKDETPVPPTPLEGVYLYLGFSKKDARVMMDGRKEVREMILNTNYCDIQNCSFLKVSDKIPESEEEEEVEVVATVQQAVSYFTSNFNKVHMEEGICKFSASYYPLYSLTAPST